jgi:predicted PurR-regulated permease PerM
MSDGSRSGALLYALVVLGIYLAYLVLGPFLVALTWAVIFAMLFHGMHVWLARKMTPGRAALVTTLVIAALIVAPAGLLISSVVREAPQVTDYLKETSRSAPAQFQRIWDGLVSRSVSLPRIQPRW